MIVEVLFKELYTYGEIGNVEYLEKMLPNDEFIYTSLLDDFYFEKNRPDIIYIGPFADKHYDYVVEKLIKVKDRLKELIEDGVYFFVINDSMALFGNRLEIVGDCDKKTLSLFNYASKRDYSNRQFNFIVGEYEGNLLLGNNMTFTEYFGNENNYIYKIVSGFGFNYGSKLGGFRYKNAILIEMLGNIFMYNPEFSKSILRELNRETVLPFEDLAYKSYNDRKVFWKKEGVY